MRLVVHGDDFTVLGLEEDLDWSRRKFSEVFEVKFRGRIGPAEGDDKFYQHYQQGGRVDARRY